MLQCAYCRSTPRNVATGKTVFCNDQCHDAYFGVNEPQHSPEALEAAGYEPCSICGTLSQDQFCSDECLDSAVELDWEAQFDRAFNF